jgi:hypothetical protein
MNDGISRLLERLQSGWGPDANEIYVPQRDLLNWGWWQNAGTQSIVLHGQDIDGGLVIVMPVWIDPRLEWCVTDDEFVWLYDDAESDKVRYLGG